MHICVLSATAHAYELQNFCSLAACAADLEATASLGFRKELSLAKENIELMVFLLYTGEKQSPQKTEAAKLTKKMRESGGKEGKDKKKERKKKNSPY